MPALSGSTKVHEYEALGGGSGRRLYLPTSYGSILAFFVLGAALIAVGVFLSSLTDNQGFAAGIGIAVILLNYYSVSLSESVSSSAIGSIAALAVGIVLLWFLIRYLTRNEPLAWVVCVVLYGILMISAWTDASRFEGLLPDIMTKLSLFERFYVFVSVEDAGGGQICWFASDQFLDELYNAYSSGANLDMATNALSSLIGESESMAIRSKSLGYDYLTISDSVASLLKVVMVGIFPLTYLGIGICMILKRRRVQYETV